MIVTLDEKRRSTVPEASAPIPDVCACLSIAP
jgi:hypothetical protein